MAIAVAIMGGVLLLAILVIVVLSAALLMAVEQINEQTNPKMDIPPIKWDYSRETGWVDAEVTEENE